MKLILLGPPGCGKGTQASAICKKFKIDHISTGDLLRNEIENNSELGIAAKAYVNIGALVPAKIIINMTLERLGKTDDFLLDGFPRNIEQARELSRSQKIDLVINISVPDEMIIERISKRLVCKCGESFHQVLNPPKKQGICDKCGAKLFQRKDDNPETVKKRLEIYHKETEPLIDFYKDILKTVDGTPSVKEVTKSIFLLIESYFGNDQ